MKKSIVRYGAYGSIMITSLFFLGLFVGQYLDYSMREVWGYATMIISLSFIFFGIKYYRDQENGGSISFKNSLKMGVLISLIVALVFGIIDVIYIEFINPDFMNEYYAHSVETLKNSVPAEEFQEKLKELESQKEFFSSSFMNFLVMSMTVFVLGFIISLISALFLQRK